MIVGVDSMFNDNNSNNCVIDENKNCSNFNDYMNTNTCNNNTNSCNNYGNNNTCNTGFNFSGILPIIIVIIIFILFFCNNKNEC